MREMGLGGDGCGRTERGLGGGGAWNRMSARGGDIEAGSGSEVRAWEVTSIGRSKHMQVEFGKYGAAESLGESRAEL